MDKLEYPYIGEILLTNEMEQTVDTAWLNFKKIMLSQRTHTV